MSLEELEDQVDNLLQEVETLEEKCDTLPACEEDDACKKCATYKKIEDLSAKVAVIEDKIEKLMGEEEEED